jgi:putative SOS response-associated peptidase YedK
MCARFEQSLGPRECQLLAAQLGITLAQPASPGGTIRPSDEATIVTSTLVMGATFGFSRPDKRLLINARSETISQRPTFRRLLDRGRVLIPMNAFYESGPTGSFIFQGTTTPSLLLAAGLLDAMSRSFVILTQDANDVVAQVHGRMPVLMTIDNARSWLDWGALGHGTIDLDSQPETKATAANTPARRRGQTRTATDQLDEALPRFEQGRLE